MEIVRAYRKSNSALSEYIASQVNEFLAPRDPSTVIEAMLAITGDRELLHSIGYAYLTHVTIELEVVEL